MHHALRRLLAFPGFTITALITLALGIGLNTSMFSVLTAVLLRDLPYPDESRLVRVYRTTPHSQNWPHAPANFLDQQAQNSVFEGMAALSWSSCNVAEPGQPAERLRSLEVSADFFSLLNVPPATGRHFTREEDRPGAAKVVVLSYSFWLRRYALDPAILGREIRLNGEPVTVIGVTAPSFEDRLLWGPIDVWRPIAFSDQTKQMRDNNYLNAIARLKPGVSLRAAQAEMSGIAARLAAAYPINNAGSGLRLEFLAHSGQDASGQRLTWFVMGLAVFVLLIACANLANLEFARSIHRAREYAIRAALGASRWRLTRELLTETLLLGLAGGTVGLLVAVWCNDFLASRIVVADQPGFPMPVDYRVLGFALAISLGTGLAFGLMPAWLSSRTDVNDALKQGSRTTGGRSHHRVRNALIVAEVALALVLLAGASFFIRGLQGFMQRDPGWRADGVLVGYVNLPGTKYSDAAKRRAFFDQLQERLQATTGVESVAFARSIPSSGFNSSTTVVVEGRPKPERGREPLSYLNFVSPSYFDTLGIRLKSGRVFNAGDRPDSPGVVVINETMARVLFPGENPIGKRIGGPAENTTWREIIGVVADVHPTTDISAPDSRLQMYRCYAQSGAAHYSAILARTQIDPNAFAAALRAAVASVDAEQPVHAISTLQSQVELGLANFALVGWLLAGFATLGVSLAAIGIYGVVSGSVAQRTTEIGIRMALGAQIRDILRLILGQGVRLALAGTALGLFGAWGVGRMLASFAPELPNAGLGSTAAITTFLVGVAAIASWIPARRATSVNPMTALRAE